MKCLRIAERYAYVRLFLSVLCLCGLTAWMPDAHAAAGRTVGRFQVSPTGSAQYTIPIWAPPGPRGVQPAISLVYDSDSGIGPLGVGWSLAGLGAITRCNTTVAQDGAAAPVALQVSDGYCINGNRLRLISGTYGEAGSIYYTEIFDRTQITAVGTQGNGPASFTVRGPDGTTYYYGYVDSNGNGANSQVIANGTMTVLTWFLSKVEDPDGNNYVINYTALTGTAQAAQILWTPTAAGASTYTYTMTFNYGSSNAPSSIYKYVAGTLVYDPNILTSIEVSHNGTVVKDYVLGYEASQTTGRYQLTQVQECVDSSGSNCLAATQMTYQQGGIGVSTSSVSALSSSASSVNAQYDFNGDGRTDLVYASGGTWYVALNDGSGFDTPINTGISSTDPAAFGDVLGDGQDGILANNGGTFYYYTYDSASGSFSGVSTGLAYNTSYSQYNLVDLDGTGLPDLVGLDAPPGYATISILAAKNTSEPGTGSAVSFSSNWTTLYSLTGSNIAAFSLYANSGVNDGALRTLDFNGDGRQDLFIRMDKQQGKDGIDDYTFHEFLSNGSDAALTDEQIASLDNEQYTQSEGVFFVNWNSDCNYSARKWCNYPWVGRCSRTW